MHIPRSRSPNISSLLLPGPLEILEELCQQAVTAHSLGVTDDGELLLGSSYGNIQSPLVAEMYLFELKANKSRGKPTPGIPQYFDCLT